MRKSLVRFILTISCISTWWACENSASHKLFTKLNPENSGIQFLNKLVYSDSLTVLEFEYMFNGGGVAFLDINNDSLQDVILSGNMVPCKLFLNKGNLQFEDITDKSGFKTAGWSYGVSVVDINQDGYQDVYICKAGSRKTAPEDMRNVFFINNGNNTFTESAEKMGLAENGYDIHSAFFDYDKDGDLDMYLLRNAFVNYNRNNSRPKEISGKAASTDKMFRNNGDGTFSDVSAQAGILIEGFGLGVNICDINNDNWPDVYVSNDFLTNDLVWVNNHDGTFTNKAPEYLRHTTYNGMGNDVADFNNDGFQDVVVVDMLPPDNKRWKLTMMGNTYDEFQQNISNNYEAQYVRNTLQLNNGNGSFSEVGHLAGIEATEWSWAPLFADFDNDGWKDLFISNGYRQDVTNLDFIMYGKQVLFMGTPEANRKERLKALDKLPGINVHNYLFKNKGDLTFSDVSKDWGMTDDDYSNGAAYADLDNDGDLDLVINNLDQPSAVYENHSSTLFPGNSWLKVTFEGREGNRDGLGAKVWIWQNGAMQYNYHSPYRGYLSTMAPLLHFGIGNKKVDSLKVLWPDGSKQLIRNIEGKQVLKLRIKDAMIDSVASTSQNIQPLFSSIDHSHNIRYRHEEDDFNDFKVQPILPRMHSREGPSIAVGDVNGDGLDDFYTGAASGKYASIFLQQPNGTFRQQTFPDSNRADNMGALLFDGDKDGDLDLYVSAGGSSVQKKQGNNYRHTLYLNDGKGNFNALADGIPPIVTPASSVIGADYDRDGDIDLFVAGRVSSGEYPYSPQSFLLRNDTKNGKYKFTDVTKESNPALLAPGMVTASLWSDFNNDGWLDLILAGEFMPIRFFENTKGKFREITNSTGLSNTGGWWSGITGGDFDKDGDIDYLLGNVGLNGPYTASAEHPVCIYASDYDKNGRIDPVMCHFISGKEYIVHARDDMNKQITSMRGRFRTYEDYATVTFRESFRKDEVEEAYVVKAERFESSYLRNLGNGKFEIQALPIYAQFSPIYGMTTGDYNGDGNLDVAAVGNSFSTEVQTGRYDARGSLLLFGDGKGNFNYGSSPFSDHRDNKTIAAIQLQNGRSALIVGANSDSLKMFSLNRPMNNVAVRADESYALITDRNGKQYRQEFYYGHTFLSQESRTLSLPSGTKSVTLFTYTGNKRTLNL